MKKNLYKIKKVTRGGGLVETNSSSSHALCICSNSDSFAKPGDPEFDLNIVDGVLYVSGSNRDFGWEYEKTNHCDEKLLYVCALVFSNYRKLSIQKEPKRLTDALKGYLGVRKVVFDWEENYKKARGKNEEGEEVSLDCPTIDHQSYYESKEEILESKSTMINFIFNKKSWFFGGNDNSSDPVGFYSEMEDAEESEPDGIVEIDFPGIGVVDFDIKLSSLTSDFSINKNIDIVSSIRDEDDLDFFESIVYASDTKKFIIDDSRDSYSGKKYKKDTFIPITGDITSGICNIVYVRNQCFDSVLGATASETGPKRRKTSEIIRSTLNTSDYILQPAKVISKEFGVLYDIH